MQAATGTISRSTVTSAATCSKLPPRENSAPAVFSIKMVSPPPRRSRPPRAGGENLEGAAAQAISALGGEFGPAGGRGVNADAARSAPGRRLRRRLLENVAMFLRHRAGHRY